MNKNIASSLRDFRKRWSTKIALYAGTALGAILVIMFFLQYAFLDGFLKSRVARAFEKEYPAYSMHIAGFHYSIFENRLACDSIALIKTDSTFSCSVATFSVSGISRIQLLWGGGVAPDNLVSADAEAKNIVLNFHRLKYELRCERLYVSVPDSEIMADTVVLHPTVSDDQFFGGSKFRKTRYRLVLPRLRVMGSASLGLMEGQVRGARTAQLDDAYLDILINKDKPFALDSLLPPMPNDLLASIAKIIRLDELKFTDGRLTYGERFAAGEKPALLSFEQIQILAQASPESPDSRDTVVIRAEGKIMNAGIAKVVMRIPVPSAEFTMGYSGSLSGMGLMSLNPFLETAEHQRFKSGELESLSFNIQVRSGNATGTVTALYRDLRLATIDAGTGSESGVMNSIASFISNNIALHTTNLREPHGAMKIGEVHYTRKHGDYFFEFAWFSLRSGIGDVVGF